MSKKRKQQPEQAQVQKQAEYYKLNTRAVNDLVTANEENSPQVSEEELRAYRSGPRMKVADWVKMLLIKAWFAGAVCYFFIWGLGWLLSSGLELLLVTGFALGAVTDLLTNPVLRFFEKTRGENERWMMVERRTYSGLFLNILYAYVVLFLVVALYSGINLAAARITGAADRVVLGVEPVLFGVFYLGFDLLLIKVKHLIRRQSRPAAEKPAQ